MATDALVIGGGMAGLVAALRLAQHNKRVTLVEQSDHLGGLASSFEHEGRTYPLGYHHILSTDAHLLAQLARLGLLDRVHWKRLEMGFSIDGEIHGLAGPADLWHFPIPWRAKLGMAARVATAWRPLAEDEPASDWLQRVAGSSAVSHFFNPLTQIKFGLPTAALSAAWLRARTQGREAHCRYGYMPNADWVNVVVSALHDRLKEAGVDIRLNTAAEAMLLNPTASRVIGVRLSDGEEIRPAVTIAAIAPPILNRLTAEATDPALTAIDYTGVVSTVVATRDDVPLDRYWTNFIRPTTSFGGIFRLDLLNDSLGQPGMRILNFCTHVRANDSASMLHWTPKAIEARYLDDFEQRFGQPLRPEWTHTSRIPLYSPVFVHGYKNPGVTHSRLSNVFLAGNHRTFPVLATTGSAMGSGAEAARAALQSPSMKLSTVGDTEAA
jgi:protoporphyrinogen oxidase